MNPAPRHFKMAVATCSMGTLLLIWLSLGVGIIGRDGDPANRMYLGVVALEIIGAFLARFRARGMAYTLLATALTQAVVGLIALFGHLGRPWSGPLELSLLNGFFVLLFLMSAELFRRAAKH